MLKTIHTLAIKYGENKLHRTCGGRQNHCKLLCTVVLYVLLWFVLCTSRSPLPHLHQPNFASYNLFFSSLPWFLLWRQRFCVDVPSVAENPHTLILCALTSYDALHYLWSTKQRNSLIRSECCSYIWF